MQLSMLPPRHRVHVLEIGSALVHRAQAQRGYGHLVLAPSSNPCRTGRRKSAYSHPCELLRP